jgi:lysophospholipase L1-like esterase
MFRPLRDGSAEGRGRNRCAIALPLALKGGILRRRSWILLAIFALTAGCGSRPSLPESTPDRPVLTQTTNRTFVAIIGDSYTSGPKAGEKTRWPALVEEALKSQGTEIDPVIGAHGGSGYADHSKEGSVRFIDQVRQVAGTNDRLVILFGSAADQTELPDKLDRLRISVERTLSEAKKTAPAAKFLVIGPAWGQRNPSAGILQARDVIKGQAEGFGATFVDPIAEGWFVDHPEMVSANGDRPTDLGHAYMAERIAPLVAQQLQGPPPH